jgi:hypothetical protein
MKALLLAAVLLAAPVLAQDSPDFLIESITVDGASSAAARIVVAESRLREGETYGEPQLRDAVARIQRLPFVLWTDFRLEKGTSVGRYVLVIEVRQMKPVFLNARSTTRWTHSETFRFTPQGREPAGTVIDQHRINDVTIGTRTFVGRKGMLNLAAQRFEDRNDRFTVTFTQYDLFGSRASIAGLVSYLEDPGAFRSGLVGERYDWHFRDNLTWELIGVLPLTDNDSIRASWQRGERPVRYFVLQPAPHPVLRSLPQIRKELFWIHDTTNDPLFPTRGTRIAAGATRTSTPTAGFTELGRVKHDEYRLTAERSWSLTPRHAVTAGGSGLEIDRRLTEWRAFARYSIDLWGRERTLRNGDLRLELEADREFSKQKAQFFPRPWSAESTARLSVAYRNVWGVVRLEFTYNDWRQP